MTFALVFVVTGVACFALRNPILKYPWLFYGLAVSVNILLLIISLFGAPYGLWKSFFVLIQKCLLPFALFVVVMFIGCFTRTSKVSRWLRPIRAELSIIASILTLGHVITYIGVYVPRVFSGAVKANVTLAFLVALILLVLLILLGATSFQFVKRQMKTETWTKLQKWAYAFFCLIYAHLLLILLPSALGGGSTATVSILVYSAVFLTYAISRTVRAIMDRQTPFNPSLEN